MEPLEGTMTGTQSLENISTKLQRIAESAGKHPNEALTALAHHIDVALLQEAHRRTRKDGAAGIDGEPADAYATNLDENLRSLLSRLHSGSYVAPPVRRVHIPKDGGKTRPIGIPTFEDKILQRAVAMVLDAIYEREFHPCSYGFRRGRSAHQALEDLWDALMSMRGGLVLEVDIEQFFDTLDHAHLRSFLDRRVRDGVLRKMIGKWLKAGVLESGAIRHPDEGTPQGGVISPLLANIYLHEVLDLWFEHEVKPRLSGEFRLIRYADDFVIAFSSVADARRVMAVLPKRFAKYGLKLHPVKTRMVDFRRPRRRGNVRRNERPQTFDLLGFTLYWGKSRQGNWVIKHKTARSRFNRALRAIARWCKEHRHWPIPTQHDTLSRKLRGHYGYFGITSNYAALSRLRNEVERVWRRWLRRRSQRDRMNWKRFTDLIGRHPLPPARIVHRFHRPVAKPTS
jgi:RNA-directed DNA polymerase